MHRYWHILGYVKVFLRFVMFATPIVREAIDLRDYKGPYSSCPHINLYS